METQNEFVAKRLAAHKAACADITADPLVVAALEAKRQTAEVMARWADRRNEVRPNTPDRRASPRFVVRRQAE